MNTNSSNNTAALEASLIMKRVVITLVKTESIEASETNFVISDIATQSSPGIKNINRNDLREPNDKANMIPKVVATAFPPLNPANIG